MKIKYASNNSGGSWWLGDEDWIALEKAGWIVEWFEYEKESSLSFLNKNGRFLGTLAKYASKDFETPTEALKEFEKITGANVADEGCNCCGAPHCFVWEDKEGHHYISGEDCLTYLFPNKKIPQSLREAIENDS